jgi:cytochrome c
MVHCARCHGDDAVGGVMAPDLRGSVAKGRVDQASFHAVVADGRRDKGMPGFKGTLADDQIKKIFAYVRARGKGEIPAGRPG